MSKFDFKAALSLSWMERAGQGKDEQQQVQIDFSSSRAYGWSVMNSGFTSLTLWSQISLNINEHRMIYKIFLGIYI